MQIETVKDNGDVFIINDQFFVPKDIKNRHYKAIQKWVAEGGVVEIITE